MNDTIFALSSGHGKAGVAVIRISGTDLRDLVIPLLWRGENLRVRAAGDLDFRGGFAESGHTQTLNTHPRKLSGTQNNAAEAFRPSKGGELTPRHAYLTDITDITGELVDKAIIIYFAAPNSFTGEDVIEIHCHGAPAVIAKIFEMLCATGARMAEPGEFSRRAFANNKMDLIEVDGLAALLDARTEKQRAAAIRVATGAVSDVYMKWRIDMIEIAAYSAAMLDYPADELPANIGDIIALRIKNLHTDIKSHLGRARAARAIRAGFNIAIVGPVNAGKSSLFNRLVGESRAIVSECPGTTRDVVSAEIDIDGYLVRLMDTAGLRETNDAVEKMGIERTQDATRNANLVIRVQSSECKVQLDNKPNEIIVINKCDLKNNCNLNSELCTLVSALTGAGIDELLARIKTEIHARLDGAENDIAINARVATLLEDAVTELEKSAECRVQSADDNENKLNSELCNLNSDLIAEHVRRAADAVGRVLGVIDAYEIADKTFGQLCLGK